VSVCLTQWASIASSQGGDVGPSLSGGGVWQWGQPIPKLHTNVFSNE
jgi:hypothetical protein